MKREKKFREQVSCIHCQHCVTMEIVAQHSEVKSNEEYRDPPLPSIQWEAGPVFELLKCPGCKGVSLIKYNWHSEFEGDGEIKCLYPRKVQMPKGLPKAIRKEYEDAEKIKHINANLFSVQLGRILEMAVNDQKPEGNSLFERLEKLAENGTIPTGLVDAASGLRKLRNIGAHPKSGEEITDSEIPILESLCNALLEYLYSAPFLVREVGDKLAAIKNAPSKET